MVRFFRRDVTPLVCVFILNLKRGNKTVYPFEDKAYNERDCKNKKLSIDPFILALTASTRIF